MLLSFIGQITNWNNQIVLILTITKMASYALQQLTFLMPLCTLLTVIWLVSEKKHHEVLCLSFIDNSNNYIIALEIAYYCYWRAYIGGLTNTES